VIAYFENLSGSLLVIQFLPALRIADFSALFHWPLENRALALPSYIGVIGASFAMDHPLYSMVI
jgi:hypothetical protein